MPTFKKTFGATSIEEGTLAPKYSIKVAKTTVDNNIRQFVRHIEYESADGMADLMRIRCLNPDSIISNAKIFQPGNEVSLFIGYKEPLIHVGRVVIQKSIPNFPENGEQTISVVGYTKETTFSKPEKSKKRRFADYKYSDAVSDIAARYDMDEDIDPTPEKPRNWIQKANVNDYEMVQGLANITGFVFWVDGDENGIWTLHFRDPEKLEEQDKQYTFKYNDGPNSTLLSFRPELLVKDSKTKITVVVKDRRTGKQIKTTIEEESDASPDVEVMNDPTSELDGAYTTGSDIKLYFGDFSFDVISNKRFRSEEQAKFWAQQWFRRNKEDFILASGSTIGLETLMARQKHFIENTSVGFDGEYYFSKVKHVFNDNGYKCFISCRKLVP
jgi:phage protein D